MFNNTKGQIISDVAFFIFLSFLYFLIGLPIMTGIIDNIVDLNNLTGIYLFAAKIAPFIPLAAIVWFGYKKTQTEEQSNIFGGS